LTPVYGQITPSADAYTNTAAPTTNYGAQPLLNVNGATEVTFVEFNLASIPGGATISKATLKLYLNSVTTAGSFNIDYVNGAWTESKIDRSNAPALGGAIASSIPITTAQKNQYVLVDITSAVQAWQSGSQANDGIALVANGSFNATFDSKENTTTSHPPEVDVVVAGKGGVGTITGVTTSSSSGLQGGGTSGKLNLSLLTSCASGQGLAWNGSAWVCQNFKGTGSVTSVGLVAPSPDFIVTDSPVTGSGNLVLSWSGAAPTPGTVANAIVKRDSNGSFSANSITSTGTITTGTLGVNGNAVIGNIMGIGTNSPQATLNLNTGGAADFDTLLVGNNSTKGLQLRDTGAAVDLESLGVPLYVNWATANPTYIGGNSVGIGTTSPQALLNLNYAGNANADTLLVGNNTTKGVQLRDTGGAVDLESIGVPLFINNVTSQNILLSGGGGQLSIPGTLGSSLYAMTVGGILNPPETVLSAAFSNDVFIGGTLEVASTKDFRIDHPLDPTNKYLKHASIESSEVLNQYSGNVVLDDKGEARVEFPAWFAAINTDFRYQLTAIGAPGPNLYVAEEVVDNAFKIAGGAPGTKVSWLVTARRNDPYMRAHPYVVERDKPERERGYYTDPSLYGAPKEQGIFFKGQTTAKKQ
jgi:hypothetical protein